MPTLIDAASKLCIKCNVLKALNCFTKHQGMRDGTLNTCKVCKAVYDKQRRELKREEINSKARTAYHSNIISRRTSNLKSYRKHRDARLKCVRKYQKLNIKAIRIKASNRYNTVLKQDSEFMLKKKILKHIYRANILSSSDNTVTKKTLCKLKIAQDNLCAYCKVDLRGLPRSNVHLDHVIPLALKGKHTIGNIVFSCSTCNLHKGKKHPKVFGYPFFWKNYRMGNCENIITKDTNARF